MSRSNNVFAGIGNPPTTKSNNASAAPLSSGGGGTVVVDSGGKKLLAEIDMSQQNFTTMAADGDYVFNCTGLSLLTNLTGKLKNRANCGTGGSVQISGGKLRFDVRTATSLYGTGFWSSTHSPLIAWDLRAFSDISGDTLWQKWNIIIEADVDPIYVGPANGTSPQNPANCNLDIGITVGMSAYFSSNTQPDRWAYTFLRSNHGTGTPANSSNTSYAWGVDCKTSGATHQMSIGWGDFNGDTSPFGTLYTSLPTGVCVVANSRSFYTGYKNSNFTSSIPWYRYYSSASFGLTSWSGDVPDDFIVGGTTPGSWRIANQNDLWMTCAGIRTGGTAATTFAISKLRIFISERG